MTSRNNRDKSYESTFTQVINSPLFYLPAHLKSSNPSSIDTFIESVIEDRNIHSRSAFLLNDFKHLILSMFESTRTTFKHHFSNYNPSSHSTLRNEFKHLPSDLHS